MPINLNGQEFNEAELETLAKAGMLQIGQKNDPAATTLTAPALHGPLQGNANQFGALSAPGVRPERYVAMQQPNSWLNIVSVNPSDYTEERIEILTGQTPGGSTNATGFCGNPPTPGHLLTCQQLYVWGSYYIKTNLNAVPLIGQRRNRADVPGQLLNTPAEQNPFLPEIVRSMTDTRSQLAYEFFVMANDMARNTELVSMLGTAGTDASRTGWFAEFAGLRGQIKTGYTDVVTGVACPAADSVVESFNALISGNHSDGSGRSIVATWFDLMYALKSRARKAGLAVQWAVVLREEMFRTLVEIISNQYNFYQVSGSQYAERNSSADMVQELRREMASGQYLLDDQGMPVPVVFTEGLAFPAVANNTYVSDLLVVPVSINGAPGLRLEYFPMDNQYAAEFAQFGATDDIRTINNGLFIVGKRSTGLCIEYHFASRMRLILEAPFLAGRIDDIRFTYFAKSRTAIPGTSLYPANNGGGVSYR